MSGCDAARSATRPERPEPANEHGYEQLVLERRWRRLERVPPPRTCAPGSYSSLNDLGFVGVSPFAVWIRFGVAGLVNFAPGSMTDSSEFTADSENS
jgi:hypothetical protein